MEEILRKIREQFPEARGIAIIGVDGNRTIDMECNCPQCQAEHEMLKQTKENVEQEIKQENPCNEMDLFQIGNTVLLPLTDSPECLITEVSGNVITLLWFDSEQCIQKAKFTKQELKLAIICDRFAEK